MSRQLGVSHGSLAYGVAPAAPRTIFVLSVTGGVAVAPGERTVLFGRNRLDVDVCVGEDDQKITRRHGELAYDRDFWRLTNTGRLPIRLPGSRLLFAGEEPIPLTEGYTPLFLSGWGRRAHLLEIYVTGADGDRPRAATRT